MSKGRSYYGFIHNKYVSHLADHTTHYREENLLNIIKMSFLNVNLIFARYSEPYVVHLNTHNMTESKKYKQKKKQKKKNEIHNIHK